MKTIRETIIDDLGLRLQHIRTAYGYNSDMGSNFNIAIKALEEKERQRGSVVMHPGDETLEVQAFGANQYSLEVEVEGTKLFDEYSFRRREAYSLDEELRGDIIECLSAPVFTGAFENGADSWEVGEAISGDSTGAKGIIESIRQTGGAWASGTAEGTLTYRARNSTTFNAEDVNSSSFSFSAIPTGQDVKTILDNAYIDDIFYYSGGNPDPPDENQLVRGVVCVFQVYYKYLMGNPYVE